MPDDIRHVTIGFESSLPLEVRISLSAYDALKKSLSDDRGGRWHDFSTQNSEITIDMSKVVFVRIENEEQRVGF